MRTTKALIILTLLFMNIACSQINTPRPTQGPLTLTLEEFFSGPLTAHGIVKNRSGEVIRTFNATIDAHWDGDNGILDEQFIFDDGEEQARVWQLQKVSPGKYTATAGDVQGESSLSVHGNRLFLDYILRIPYKGRQLDIRVDDRMYLVNPNILLNESILYKWGFKVGAISLVIVKQMDSKISL